MYGKTSLENQGEISNKAKISYYEISLRMRHRDGQLLGVNGGCLGTNWVVGWCEVGRCAAGPFLPTAGTDTASQSVRELYKARRA
jgi:hypothetical protein